MGISRNLIALVMLKKEKNFDLLKNPSLYANLHCLKVLFLLRSDLLRAHQLRFFFASLSKSENFTVSLHLTQGKGVSPFAYESTKLLITPSKNLS